jgi:hypothetical protein
VIWVLPAHRAGQSARAAHQNLPPVPAASPSSRQPQAGHIWRAQRQFPLTEPEPGKTQAQILPGIRRSHRPDLRLGHHSPAFSAGIKDGPEPLNSKPRARQAGRRTAPPLRVARRVAVPGPPQNHARQVSCSVGPAPALCRMRDRRRADNPTLRSSQRRRYPTLGRAERRLRGHTDTTDGARSVTAQRPWRTFCCRIIPSWRTAARRWWMRMPRFPCCGRDRWRVGNWSTPVMRRAAAPQAGRVDRLSTKAVRSAASRPGCSHRTRCPVSW